MNDRSERRRLWAIVVAYLLLGVTYLLATPPLEASDEYKHYPVVQYVQVEGRLPVLDPEEPGRWLQEGAQPPLYYLLMAGLTSWIDTDDLPQLHEINRHAFIGNPNQVGNKNLILHEPEREAFPWRGSVLAIYVIRAATLLLGAGTVLLTERMGRMVFDERVGLLAAALMAFNPMFLFVHAAVNNDGLAILLGHAGLFLLLKLWLDPPHPVRNWRSYVGLGLLLGLGLLTKLSLGALLALSGLLLAWIAWRRREAHYLLVGGGLILLTAALVVAPWLWRNWELYADPTAMNVFVAVQGTRDAAMTWADWRAEFGTFYRSFWGLFGGVNVAAPELFYAIYNGLALLGAGGFGLWLWRRRNDGGRAASSWLLLLAWIMLFFGLLLRWNVISEAFQGRLIFPALGAINILLAVGYLAWFPTARRREAATVLAVGAFLAATALPWLTIRPAYAFPQALAEAPAVHRIDPVRFHAEDGDLELVGVDVPPQQSVVPGGDPVIVTLYWRAADTVARDYLSSVHLLGRDLDSVASVNRHPASGMVPTSEWESGQIWRDVYHLYVRQGAKAPARLQIRAGFYDPLRDSDLPMTSASGESLELLLVGEARLARAPQDEPPTPPTAQAVTFDDGVRLLGYGLRAENVRAGDHVELSLFWETYVQPQGDYTVFVHLLEQPGEQPITTADGPPVSGYYPTRLWREGDVVEDLHNLDIPEDLAPGAYQIGVGLYDPVTGRRVQRNDGGDTVFLELQIDAGEE